MNILYVEDDNEKASKIMKYLQSSINNCNVKLCCSYMSGILAIEDEDFDLIMLDMSLPLYDTKVEDDINEFCKFAGIDFLDEMKRIDKKNKVVVITAFETISDNDIELSLDQLKEQMNNDYPGIYVDSVFYSSKSLEWCQAIQDIINNI